MAHIPGHFKCRVHKISYETLDELSKHYLADTKSHIDHPLAATDIHGKTKLWETNGRDKDGKRRY